MSLICGTDNAVDGIHIDMNHLKKGEVKYGLMPPFCLFIWSLLSTNPLLAQ